MMKYLDEAELELKCRTFSPDFDFTNPEGREPVPSPRPRLDRVKRSGSPVCLFKGVWMASMPQPFLKCPV